MSEKNNPLKNFFSKDLHIKLFSLLAAIAAWFVVMNTIMPLETKTYSAPVRLVNTKALMNQGYIISNMESFENKLIDINIEATRTALDELSKADNVKDIYAKVDLNNITIDDSESFPQSFTVSVQPALPSYLNLKSYNITNYSPAYLSIDIDKISSAEHSLKLKTTGKSADGYEISETKLSAETVVINGPQSEMDNVTSVMATLDISSLKEDTSVNLAPVVYDKNGNVLSNFVVEPAHVAVSVKVHKRDTINIREPETIGELSPYLELESIDYSPKSITVTGSESNVAAVSEIDLDPVDLSAVRGNTTLTMDISNKLMRAGLEPKNSTDSKITVTVSVKLVNPKIFNINKSDIKITGLPETKLITLPDVIPVEISGTDNVNIAQLNPTIDVTGLSDGEHNVALNITPPPDAAIQNSVNVDVIIQSKETSSEGTTASQQNGMAENTTDVNE